MLVSISRPSEVTLATPSKVRLRRPNPLNVKLSFPLLEAASLRWKMKRRRQTEVLRNTADMLTELLHSSFGMTEEERAVGFGVSQ
ncbi:hypothetical protein GW17_00032780 [Ensete ventricosum]|nr:hypothetical protein GW17_00032780 [Ensete ventricosum]